MSLRLVLALTLCLALLVPAGGAGVHGWRTVLAADDAVEIAIATQTAAERGGCHGHAAAASEDAASPDAPARDTNSPHHECCGDGCTCGCLLAGMPSVPECQRASPLTAMAFPPPSSGQRIGVAGRLLRPPIAA